MLSGSPCGGHCEHGRLLATNLKSVALILSPRTMDDVLRLERIVSDEPTRQHL